MLDRMFIKSVFFFLFFGGMGWGCVYLNNWNILVEEYYFFFCVVDKKPLFISSCYEGKTDG